MKYSTSPVDCGRSDFVRTDDMPLLDIDAHFSFACAGCGDCCRARRDIVLSGHDLWRIAERLRLPPRIAARAFCTESIGQTSRLPVLRLTPVHEAGDSCPFLFKSRCTIHESKPLACALYPMAQEIDVSGRVGYFLQPTDCGGHVYEATVGDYLRASGILDREAVDVRWAQACMELADRVEALEARFEPALRRRMYAHLWAALYYDYDFSAPFLPQLEANLVGLNAAIAALEGYQTKRTIKKSDR